MSKSILMIGVLSSLALGLTGCITKTKTGETRSFFSPNHNTAPAPTPTAPVANPSNFGFSVPVADTQAFNVTYVPRPSEHIAKEVQRVLDGTNRLRAEKGLKPLKLDPNLSAYAQVRASEIAVQYDHRRLDGGSIFAGITNWGFLAENIYSSPKTAEEAVEGWRKSKGHYANMVNPELEIIGIGVVYDANSTWKYHWVQLFATNGAKIAYEFTDSTTNNSSPLSQVVINKTAIPLTLNQTGEWQQITTNGNQGWVNGYNHTRFGVVTPKGATASHLYYQGQRTDDTAMPKSGVATYNGTALIVKNGTVNPNAQSQFTADFRQRKLSGTIKQNGSTLFSLSADINGAAFASKASESVQAQGAFFGKNAEELSGVFKDTNSGTRGVFGAKK